MVAHGQRKKPPFETFRAALEPPTDPVNLWVPRSYARYADRFAPKPRMLGQRPKP
jgi:hypothetical protein